MKDKVARWLKAGALLLTVVALSAALVACQGAVGPTGPSGADGTDGTDGTQGPKGDTGDLGDPGISVLVARGGDTTKASYVDNNDKGEIGVLSPIDLSTFFRGGKDPVKYKIKTPPHTDSTFKVALPKDGNVTTVSIRSTTKFTAAEYDYALPAADKIKDSKTTLFTVEAEDADEFTAMKTIAVLANRKPTASKNKWSLPKGAHIGTQSAKDSDRDGGNDDKRSPTDKMAFSCKTFDTCVLVPDVTTSSILIDFRDDNYHADNKLSYSVVPGRVSISAVSVTGGNDITITGLKSTWDDTSKSHVPVIVTIEAADKGGLSVERDLEITVDEAPTMKSGLITSKTVKVDADGANDKDDGIRVIVGAIGGFFENPEGNALTITAESSNEAVANVPAIKDDLAINAKNTGDVVVTVTASDKLGQSVSHEIAVNIID